MAGGDITVAVHYTVPRFVSTSLWRWPHVAETLEEISWRCCMMWLVGWLVDSG